MRPPADLTGLASAVVAPAALRQLAQRSHVPAALLQVLLSIYLFRCSQPNNILTTPQLSELHLLSLPLLRGYIRQLEAGGYVRRESFFRRGPRLLGLTTPGHVLASQCAAHIRRAAQLFLDGEAVGTAPASTKARSSGRTRT